MRLIRKCVATIGQLSLYVILLVNNPAQAQEQTVGLLYHDPVLSYQGYTLFTPFVYPDVYLIDNDGHMVNSWHFDVLPAGVAYLLDNGNILRCGKVANAPGGGDGGLVQIVDWDGTLVWEYEYNTETYWQHHDLEALPNGNILILAYEVKDAAEAIAAGRDPALLASDQLWPEHIVEVEPTGPTSGNIVWEWHSWDHLIQDFDPTKDNYGVVEDHPELMDLNFTPIGGSADWLHANSICYNPDFDQIAISLRSTSEMWVIDHSTTTAEAAGHTGGNRGMGGDILYRWGNPQAYRAGISDDRKYFGQHAALWVPPGYPGAGNITVFNNGLGRPEILKYSTIDEIITPVDINGDYPQPPTGMPHGPAAQTWIYTADPPESFFASSGSSAHRLPNGNTLACESRKGLFTEVTSDGDIVWLYKSPIGPAGPVTQGQSPRPAVVPAVLRYAPDHPGLVGKDLTPKGPLEHYLIYITGAQHSPLVPIDLDSVVVTATMSYTTYSEISTAEMYVDTGDGYFAIPMFDDGGHHDGAADDSEYGAVIPPVSDGTTVWYYLYASDDSSTTSFDPPSAPAAAYVYTVGYTPPQLYINEILADNTVCCPDEYSDYDGWIELYNAEAEPVDLTGMYLTNNPADPALFLIGDLTIPAGGFMVFWADGETGEGPTHTNFTLSEIGGSIGLWDADTHPGPLDTLSYGAQSGDVAYARIPDGSATWFSTAKPTPEQPNVFCDCSGFCDVDLDGTINPVDVVLMVNYVYKQLDARQPLPDCPMENGDWDCTGQVNPVDVVFYVNHVYRGWATTPCNPCLE